MPTAKVAPSTTKEQWIISKEQPALETAVVYDGEASKKCGCSLPLAPLMDYLESSANKKTSCPICQAPIEVVCDGMVDKKSEEGKVVTFKYRKHLYRLSVIRDPNATMPFPYSMLVWMWNYTLLLAGEDTTFTAQERIAQVLRMDLQGGMRILHKGKILYPNAQQSSRIVSEQLLDVCAKGGKPLVMGTRMTLREQKIANLRWCYNLFYGLLNAFISKIVGMARGIVSPFLGGGGGGVVGNAGAIDQRPHCD